MKEFLGSIDEYLEYRQKETLREVSLEKSKLESKRDVKAAAPVVETPIVEAKPTTSFVTKEQKAVQNKIKKVEEQISSLETEIEAFELDFTKNNPSDETLEVYNSKKEALDLALQEWEYLGSQLD